MSRFRMQFRAASGLVAKVLGAAQLLNIVSQMANHTRFMTITPHMLALDRSVGKEWVLKMTTWVVPLPCPSNDQHNSSISHRLSASQDPSQSFRLFALLPDHHLPKVVWMPASSPQSLVDEFALVFGLSAPRIFLGIGHRLKP